MNVTEVCTICMEDIKNNNYCKLSCNHYFCLDCIFSQYSYKNQCPICRELILKNKIQFKKKHFVNNQLPPSPPPSPPYPRPSIPLTPPPSYNLLHSTDSLVNNLIEEVNNLSDKITALELQQNFNNST